MGLQVDVLEQSFKTVAPKGDEFVATFYARLFETLPEVKPLFGATDMAAQRKKLLSALVLAVENLRRPRVLFPALKDLGRRHAGYGAKPEHSARWARPSSTPSPFTWARRGRPKSRRPGSRPMAPSPRSCSKEPTGIPSE
jgi:hypothetical protein